MSKREDDLSRLRRFNRAVREKRTIEHDEPLVDEELFADGEKRTVQERFDNESIIRRQERPVLAIKADNAELVFAKDLDRKIWEQPLKNAAKALAKASRAVGRIELIGHASYEWIGTGWLIAPDIMVTNRHVAIEFADGNPLVFRTGVDGRISASIDFLQELESDATRLFEIVRPLHIEPSSGPDLAFFKVKTTAGDDSLAAPIELVDRVPDKVPAVVVIGYPARDTRIPDWKLMDEIYGDVYDKKRLAPGEVTKNDGKRLFHNCTTLGGNSGSVVLDLATGRALGLHYSGSFLVSNYAVPADVVKHRLDDLLRGRLRQRSAGTPPRRRREVHAQAPRGVAPSAGTAAIRVPLVITVSLGELDDLVRQKRPQARSLRRSLETDVDDGDVAPEAVAADYDDRQGYQADFLGAGFEVELPTVEGDPGDVLEVQGDDDGELRYEHFSVKMSRSRRMCLFSAVNIHGEHTKKTKRPGWRTDPRIAKNAQILHECYGKPPKFSRGHMTRREDPAWGDKATAHRGNADSMHVSNAVPQMQAFNSPIWLALENYALENAKDDDMKISVFTGPYFDYGDVEDPVIDGVSIPRAFWKVIAFVHDVTGKLCATGYQMSQAENLPDQEFVFGDFVSSHLNQSTQVAITSIEMRSGLRFDRLAEVDPLRDVDEAASGTRPLASLEEIRFL